LKKIYKSTWKTINIVSEKINVKKYLQVLRDLENLFSPMSKIFTSPHGLRKCFHPRLKNIYKSMWTKKTFSAHVEKYLQDPVDLEKVFSPP